MKYIKDMREGDRIFDIYLCKHKQAAVTKNGKPYENVILQDKTGTIDAKIWDPGSIGIDDFDTMDYVAVTGDVTSFQGNIQLNIKHLENEKDSHECDCPHFISLWAEKDHFRMSSFYKSYH